MRGYYRSEIAPPKTNQVVSRVQIGPTGPTQLPEWDESRHGPIYDRIEQGKTLSASQKVEFTRIEAAFQSAKKTAWQIEICHPGFVTLPDTDEWRDWVEFCLKPVHNSSSFEFENCGGQILLRQSLSKEQTAKWESKLAAEAAGVDIGSGYGRNTAD